MLRPTPSRISITTSDIHDLKVRLAKRPAQLQSVRTADWFTVHTTIRRSQNSRPPRWHKGVLRTGPARERDFVINHSNEVRADQSPSIAAISNTSSSQYGEDLPSDLMTRDQDTGVSSTAINLAEARRALDELSDRATTTSSAIAAPIPYTLDIEISRPSSAHDSFGLPGFLFSHEQKDAENGPGFDGANDLPLRPRGGDSYSPYRHAIPHNHNVPDEYRLPHLPRLVTRTQFSIARSLDPLAPSFIPTVRLGSAHDEHRASTLSNDQDSQLLRVRPISSINSGNSNYDQISHRTQTGTHSLQTRRGDHDRHVAGNLTLLSSSHRQIGSSLTHSATSAGRHSISGHSASSLPIDATTSSVVPPTQVQEPSNSSPSNTTTRPNSRGPRGNVVDQASTSAWPRRYVSTRPLSSSTTYSVLDSAGTTFQGPVVHSRQSSLTWNRAAPDVTNLGGTYVPRGATTRSHTHTPSSVSVYYPSGYHDPPQSFYLNHSPLDELTAGLRRFSAASSVGQSSGGSNPMRPFRGNLLSGSLFYSEDLYYEDHQSSSESEPPSNRSYPSGTGSDIPPLFADHLRRPSHNSVHVPESSPNPQTSSASSHDLGTSPPVGSSRYSGSSPLPLAFHSASHISPDTAEISYSMPLSSEPSGPLFTSSPPRIRSIPSDRPLLAPPFNPPSTPIRSRTHEPSITHEDRRTRPTPISRFRIYEDDLPANMQPKTPADIGRRISTRSSVPSKSPTSASGSTRSLVRSRNRRSYPATQTRPIFEPTTAELTTIPFLSPLQSARQPRARRRRGHNRSTSEDQENEFDPSAIIGLEDERVAWMRRRVETEGEATGLGIFNILEETPPREGRFERMMRS